MNCADVRARLPALLYGDLADDEANEVRQHMARCTSCREEHATVARVRRLLDVVPVPAVTVDLARLYREGAALQAHRLRRWRRIACASLAAAAAVVLTLLLSRIEVRLDVNQVVLRWGAVPAPPEPLPPAPRPEPPVVATLPTTSTAEIEQELRLLNELVQALSNDADSRDERRQREVARLRGQVQVLQQQMTVLRLTTEKDVAALYAAQFPEREKGTPAMKWRCCVLFLVLLLPVARAPGQDTRFYPLVGEAQLSPDGQRLIVAKDSEAVREQYEEIEIMARLLDRGLSRDAHVGALTDAVRSVAFSPDGTALASGTLSGGVRVWDAATGKQLAAHGAEDSGAQGVYLKGQGVVYSLTIPLHFQKPVAGPDKPAPKALTEWERVRKELRGEKVESEKPREHADTSIADVVLKVLADNGKNLTRLPDGESVTVAITLLPAQSCVQCHSESGAGGMRGPMGGSGMMPPGGMGGGHPPAGGGASGSGGGGGSPFGSGFPGGGRPSGGLGGSTSGSGGSGSTSGSSTSGGGGSSSTTESEPNADRTEFRKYALLGDLAMKQHDYTQAADAYRKALGNRRNFPQESALQLEVVEVASKMARALIAQGKSEEAETVVQGIAKITDRLTGGAAATKPAGGKAPMPLPGKLIISVPKKILDQAGSGKMSFDEFRKVASVEYLTFDKPAEKAKGNAVKP